MDLIRNLSFARYFFRRQARHPIYLLYFVTSRCMGRCAHCFYWKELNQPEDPLTPAETDRIAASMGRLLQVTFTGGEPFLRDDFPLLVRSFYTHNRPVNLAIATSGFHFERVRDGVRQILIDCPDSQVTVGLPIEGPPELNDRIRGVEGFFERTHKTLRQLKVLQRNHPRLTLLVDLTVSAMNQDQLIPTYKLIKDQLRPDAINFILVRGQPQDPASLSLDPEKAAALARVMEEDIRFGEFWGYRFLPRLLHAKDIVLRRMALDIFRDGRARVPCTAGALAGVLLPEGDLRACELRDDSFGRLRDHDYDVPRLWNSVAGMAIRKTITESRCTCYHQCFLSPSIFFNPKMAPAMFREWRKLL